jgi:esterase/lipase
MALELGLGYAIPEYPGYSLFPEYGSERRCEQIQDCALRVYDYLKDYRVIVLGRSIGSGPALWLCSVRRPLFLVLLSPFLGIKEMVKDRYGSFVSKLVAEHFDNKTRARCVCCPTLVIHGRRDEVVLFRHSVELNKELQVESELVLIEDMQHSNFNFY